MADVNITYKGASIATMGASGTKTLETSGKYCEDDITIEYVAPTTPTKPTQPLSVTENGTYTAPSGTAYTPVTVNVPTGGSLPSVISKIDGGSFTFVADTAIQSNKINHSLGIKPKGYIIWSESVMTDDVAYANQTLMFSYGIGLPWKNAGTTNNVGYSYAMWRRTNGAVSEQNSSSPTITDTQIAPQGFYYWRGGVQYNWLAWA